MRILKPWLVALPLAAGALLYTNEFCPVRGQLMAINDLKQLTPVKPPELFIRRKVTSDSTATLVYELDAGQSKFFARAPAGGLLWFKGKDHLVAVREFTGEAQITPDSINPAALEITAKAASMVETRDVFTAQQKEIINKELREIVLEPEKYPDIIFKSTNVTGKSLGGNQYELKISGNLTLHGATRPITIPTQATITGNDLRARGKFSIDRDDFKVKATSAVHGLVRVRNKVEFTFDIVGHQR